MKNHIRLCAVGRFVCQPWFDHIELVSVYLRSFYFLFSVSPISRCVRCEKRTTNSHTHTYSWIARKCSTTKNRNSHYTTNEIHLECECEPLYGHIWADKWVIEKKTATKKNQCSATATNDREDKRWAIVISYIVRRKNHSDRILLERVLYWTGWLETRPCAVEAYRKEKQLPTASSCCLYHTYTLHLK